MRFILRGETWILSVIWLNTVTKSIFRTFDLAEHLALNSFIIAQATLVALVGMVIFKVSLFFNPFIYLLMMWMIYKIFRRPKKTSEIIQSIGSVALFFNYTYSYYNFDGINYT